MKKILVVEDSAAVRAMIVSIVQTVPGIECVDAEDGLAALKALPADVAVSEGIRLALKSLAK